MPPPASAVVSISSMPRLIQALLDFEELPGRYPLALREPRTLFDNSREVLLLALGRPVEGLILDRGLDAPRLQRAACFFVRTAMLRTGIDHYTLLGLQPGFDKDDLRDHYRMLIRLTHPDVAISSAGWPAGAATRLNLANDVLSSPVSRAAYDQALHGDINRMPVPRVRSMCAVLPRPAAVTPRPVSLRNWTLVGMAAAAGLLMLAQWPSLVDVPDEVQVSQADQPIREALGGTAPGLIVAALVPQTQSVSASISTPRNVAAKPASGERAGLAQPAVPTSVAAMAKPGKLVKTAPETPALKELQNGRVRQAAQTDKKATIEAKSPKESKAAQKAEAARLIQQAATAKAERAVLVAKEARTAARLQQLAQAVQQAPAKNPVPLAQPAVELIATKPAQIAKAAQDAPAPAVAWVEPATPVARLAQPQPQPLIEPAARISLADAQPLLNQFIQAMQGGRGEDVLRGVERSLRQSAGAADFVNAYNALVDGSRAVRLGPVQLHSRPASGQLAVEGVVQLVLHDQGQPLPVRELRWRALFAQRDGQVVMTELSPGGVRR